MEDFIVDKCVELEGGEAGVACCCEKEEESSWL